MERVYAAVFLILLASSFIYKSVDYGIGTSLHPGPGYFPLLLAVVLIGLSSAIALREFRLRHVLPSIGKWPLKQLAYIIGALLLFVVLVGGGGIPGFKGSGLVIAVFLLVSIVGFINHEMPVQENLLLAAALTLLAVVVFVVLFGLSIPLWPWSY